MYWSPIAITIICTCLIQITAFPPWRRQFAPTQPTQPPQPVTQLPPLKNQIQRLRSTLTKVFPSFTTNFLSKLPGLTSFDQEEATAEVDDADADTDNDDDGSEEDESGSDSGSVETNNSPPPPIPIINRKPIARPPVPVANKNRKIITSPPAPIVNKNRKITTSPPVPNKSRKPVTSRPIPIVNKNRKTTSRPSAPIVNKNRKPISNSGSTSVTKQRQDQNHRIQAGDSASQSAEYPEPPNYYYDDQQHRESDHQLYSEITDPYIESASLPELLKIRQELSQQGQTSWFSWPNFWQGLMVNMVCGVYGSSGHWACSNDDQVPSLQFRGGQSRG